MDQFSGAKHILFFDLAINLKYNTYIIVCLCGKSHAWLRRLLCRGQRRGIPGSRVRGAQPEGRQADGAGGGGCTAGGGTELMAGPQRLGEINRLRFTAPFFGAEDGEESDLSRDCASGKVLMSCKIIIA